LIKRNFNADIKFRAPSQEGAYRIFVSAFYNGKVAYANIPFRVLPRSSSDKQAKFVKFKYTTMKDFD
jgi:hypothetical protein